MKFHIKIPPGYPLYAFVPEWIFVDIWMILALAFLAGWCKITISDNRRQS